MCICVILYLCSYCVHAHELQEQYYWNFFLLPHILHSLCVSARETVVQVAVLYIVHIASYLQPCMYQVALLLAIHQLLLSVGLKLSGFANYYTKQSQSQLPSCASNTLPTVHKINCTFKMNRSASSCYVLSVPLLSLVLQHTGLHFPQPAPSIPLEHTSPHLSTSLSDLSDHRQLQNVDNDQLEPCIHCLAAYPAPEAIVQIQATLQLPPSFILNECTC